MDAAILVMNSQGVHSSDNSTAAENQQERLIKIGWITGFVDGEVASQSTLSVSPIEQIERDTEPVSRWHMSLQWHKALEALSVFTCS